MATNFATIVDVAFDAATSAAIAHPFFDNDRGDCGRAWVVVTARKGRKAFLAEVARQYPKTHTMKHHTGGVAILVCGALQRQSRAIYEAACDAMVSYLNAQGIEAHTHSYAD